MSSHVAIGVHPCHDFLPWIAAFRQTEGFSFKVRFRRNNLFVQIRARLGKAGLDAESFTSLAADRPDAMRGARVHEPFPGRYRVHRRDQNFIVLTRRFLRYAATNADCPPIVAEIKLTGFRSATSVPNAALSTTAALGPLTSRSPQVSAQFSIFALVP